MVYCAKVHKEKYDNPSGPLSKDKDCESSDSDEYQEDESSNNYTSVQCADINVATLLNRTNLEPMPIDESTIAITGCQLQPQAEFIDDGELASRPQDGFGNGDFYDEEEYVSTDVDPTSN